MTEFHQSHKEIMHQKREQMVEEQIEARGILTPRILQALRTVPRHIFVHKDDQEYAYGDHPLSIGFGQTISQPYIVAYMIDMLAVTKKHTVLEIGTGCGYQTALLAHLSRKVISLEVIPELAKRAKDNLKKLNYNNVEIHCTDGKRGWTAHAPYHRIISGAAAKTLPDSLLNQLKNNGKIVIPMGKLFSGQYLEIIQKDRRGHLSNLRLLPVRFVPLV